MSIYNLNSIQYDRRLMHMALRLNQSMSMAKRSNWLAVKLNQMKRRKKMTVCL